MNKADFNKIMRSTPGCVGALIGTALIAGLAILAVFNTRAFVIIGLITIIVAGCWAFALRVAGWNKGKSNAAPTTEGAQLGADKTGRKSTGEKVHNSDKL